MYVLQWPKADISCGISMSVSGSRSHPYLSEGRAVAESIDVCRDSRHNVEDYSDTSVFHSHLRERKNRYLIQASRDSLRCKDVCLLQLGHR